MIRPGSRSTHGYFYPRPPRGGRHVHKGHPRRSLSISIHALREEGDYSADPSSTDSNNFYPRPPRGGRPVFFLQLTLFQVISIHALREEGDSLCSWRPHHADRFLSTPSARRATAWQDGMFRWDFHFYPRPPRGGRPIEIKFQLVIMTFLSTPSARRATHSAYIAGYELLISIHALREEGDDNRSQPFPSYKKFLSTPSARRATCSAACSAYIRGISIHALREEGD